MSAESPMPNSYEEPPRTGAQALSSPATWLAFVPIIFVVVAFSAALFLAEDDDKLLGWLWAFVLLSHCFALYHMRVPTRADGMWERVLPYALTVPLCVAAIGWAVWGSEWVKSADAMERLNWAAAGATVVPVAVALCIVWLCLRGKSTGALPAVSTLPMALNLFFATTVLLSLAFAWHDRAQGASGEPAIGEVHARPRAAPPTPLVSSSASADPSPRTVEPPGIVRVELKEFNKAGKPTYRLGQLKTARRNKKFYSVADLKFHLIQLATEIVAKERGSVQVDITPSCTDATQTAKKVESDIGEILDEWSDRDAQIGDMRIRVHEDGVGSCRGSDSYAVYVSISDPQDRKRDSEQVLQEGSEQPEDGAGGKKLGANTARQDGPEPDDRAVEKHQGEPKKTAKSLHRDNGNGGEDGPRGLQLLDYTYFAFYSITTTGYGDLVPRTGLAKFYCTLANFYEVIFTLVFFNVLVGAALASLPGKADKIVRDVVAALGGRPAPPTRATQKPPPSAAAPGAQKDEKESEAQDDKPGAPAGSRA